MRKAKKKVAKRKSETQELPGEGMAGLDKGFNINLGAVKTYTQRELDEAEQLAAKAPEESKKEKRQIKIPKKYRALFKMLKQFGVDARWVEDGGYGDMEFTHTCRDAETLANKADYPTIPNICIFTEER